MRVGTQNCEPKLVLGRDIIGEQGVGEHDVEQQQCRHQPRKVTPRAHSAFPAPAAGDRIVPRVTSASK